MGVRKATGFLTSDGRFFGPQDEAKANEHETLFRLEEFSREHLLRDPSDKELAEMLFTHREQLSRILNGLDEPTVRDAVAGDAVSGR